MTEIDVSGCKFYYDTYCNDGNYLYGACAERDCYYKQLKRLELENAKLKELLETRCYNEVEFENKKLKETLEEIKNICKPVLKVNTIERLEGKHLKGKYNLAKEIMEVLKNE